jgi:adenylate cyclase
MISIDKEKWQQFFRTKYFGLVLGVLIFAFIAFFYFGPFQEAFEQADVGVSEIFYQMKREGGIEFQVNDQAIDNISFEGANLKVHPDLLLVGIDNRALERLGRFPFRRSVYATIFQNLSRISDQNNRETAAFLDVFFIEPSEVAEEDSLLNMGIQENGRVYLEAVLRNSGTQNEELSEQFYQSLLTLFERQPDFKNVSGDWENINRVFYGIEPPLNPIAQTTRGFGHANFIADIDSVYRRQPLIAKYSRLKEEVRLEDFTGDTSDYKNLYQRWTYRLSDANNITLPFDPTPDNLDRIRNFVEQNAQPRLEQDADGEQVLVHYVRRYQDYFVPSITLALALEYWNVAVEDVEVVFGSHIYIPNVQSFNYQTGQWEEYRVLRQPATYEITEDGQYALDDNGQRIEISPAVYETISEVKIPIDDIGQMQINYVGPATGNEWQSFPYRSVTGYATTQISADPSEWRPTRRLENKILMIGPFSQGMADDEKLTPFGLMYGVEIHTNALNTILMNDFITPLNEYLHVLMLFAAIFIASFVASRLSPIWSLFVNLNAIVIWFGISYVGYMEYSVIIPYMPNFIGIIAVYLIIVAYRVIVEEREKRSLQSSFGKFVNPVVVEQMLSSPPELGGVDKELTVLFSDIRGFTTLSEGLAPQELVHHLNEYLTAMTDTIMDYQGTLDKYVAMRLCVFGGSFRPNEPYGTCSKMCPPANGSIKSA